MIYKHIILTLVSMAMLVGCATRNSEESAKHLKSGIELQNKGKLDEAMNEYNQAIELDKKNQTAWYHRGVLNVTKNNLPKGIEDLTEAIDIAPDSARFYDARGYVYITMNEY